MGSKEAPCLMAEVGEKVLKLADDPVIMNVDDLGRALFNREGDWTKSQHCISLSLASDINKVQAMKGKRRDQA